MGKSLYVECASGISGDMTAGALLDLGADEEKLKKVLATVPAKGFTVAVTKVKKSGILCTDFDVRLDDAHENHDHDMAYLYGHEADDHEHEHHHHGHDNEHEHHHHHDHEHHHEHRNLADVLAIIRGTEMEEDARAVAEKIFTVVAEAEAEAHGLPLDEVHFHEVGAIDSIVDVIAIAVCFTDVRKKENITDVIIRHVTEGSGTVRCQHGVLPIPVPAVANIARAHALPLRISEARGEYVTPTGAAFLAAVRTKDELPEQMKILRTGMGAGKREQALPGFLRMMVVE
ncbi:MAG: LarC family nickel insertion protein [Lachnospiraceae bacterium]|nr:LarC family nickel insertion protein [Lachnospiraceae bacterium]